MIAEILRKAKHILENDGWCQGTMHSSQGHCAIGALRVVSSGAGLMAAREALENVIGTPAWISAGYSLIAWWNDYPGRTKEEIIAKFDQAIASAESQDQSITISV